MVTSLFATTRSLLQTLKSNETKSDLYGEHHKTVISLFIEWLNVLDEVASNAIEYQIADTIRKIEHLLSQPANTETSPAASTDTKSDTRPIDTTSTNDAESSPTEEVNKGSLTSPRSQCMVKRSGLVLI